MERKKRPLFSWQPEANGGGGNLGRRKRKKMGSFWGKWGIRHLKWMKGNKTHCENNGEELKTQKNY